MQQGTEGTERFCIKQLLKPIDNVSLSASCVLLLTFIGSVAHPLLHVTSAGCAA